MIEIIREENWDDTKEKKLPKDIRKIGRPDVGERIYIEDEVYRYLHPYESSCEKLVYVLLGRFENYSGRQCTDVYKRQEGQVRGVRAMVEDDRYCVDIVTQVSAIQAALNGFNKELLARHIKTCVSEDIKEGNEQAVDELCELLKKLMK